MQAVGTTLGSDNGIGVAAALALLAQPASAKLPPLECLFTVDEETGLTGAYDLDATMLSGETTRTPCGKHQHAHACAGLLHSHVRQDTVMGSKGRSIGTSLPELPEEQQHAHISEPTCSRAAALHDRAPRVQANSQTWPNCVSDAARLLHTRSK